MARTILGDESPSGPTIDGLDPSMPTRDPVFTGEDVRRLAGASLPLATGLGLAATGVGLPVAVPAAVASGVFGDMLERGSTEPRVLPGLIEGATEAIAPGLGKLSAPMMRQALKLSGAGGSSGQAMKWFRNVFGEEGTTGEAVEELAETILERTGANISPGGASRMTAEGTDLAQAVRQSLAESPDIPTASLVDEAKDPLFMAAMSEQAGPARATANRRVEAILEGAGGDGLGRDAGGRIVRTSPPGSINPGGRIGFVPGAEVFDTARKGRMSASDEIGNAFLGAQRRILPDAKGVFDQDALSDALNAMAPSSGMLRGGSPGDVLASNAMAGATIGGPVLMATKSPALGALAGLAGMAALAPRGMSTMANSARGIGNTRRVLPSVIRTATGLAPEANDVFEEVRRRQLAP